MNTVVIACCTLVVATCVLHYEVLGALQSFLPRLRVPNRAKLLVVILVTFLAHAVEIGLYGFDLPPEFRAIHYLSMAPRLMDS